MSNELHPTEEERSEIRRFISSYEDIRPRRWEDEYLGMPLEPEPPEYTCDPQSLQNLIRASKTALATLGEIRKDGYYVDFYLKPIMDELRETIKRAEGKHV